MAYHSNCCFEANLLERARHTRHSAKRSQQRGIKRDSVPLILAYGERSHDGHGGVRYTLTERAMASLVAAVGYTQRLGQLVGCYAVVSADDEKTVITLGHRI